MTDGDKKYAIHDPVKKAEGKRHRDSVISRWRADAGPCESRRLDGVPATYQYMLIQALNGSIRGKRLLKLKCLECSNWQREEVKRCTVKFCPLWHDRPFQDLKSRSRTELEPADEVYDNDEEAEFDEE